MPRRAARYCWRRSSDSELRERLAVRLETFTDATVASRSDLEVELETVRERGWASVREELEVGLNAVAAPVYDGSAEVVAALSVSGPSYRLGEDAFEDIAKRTIAAAETISRRLPKSSSLPLTPSPPSGWVELANRRHPPSLSVRNHADTPRRRGHGTSGPACMAFI